MRNVGEINGQSVIYQAKRIAYFGIAGYGDSSRAVFYSFGRQSAA